MADLNDINSFRTELNHMQAQHNMDRNAFTAALQEERTSWRNISAELANISGSLRVLLDDREDFKQTIQRAFSRLDTTDKTIAMLSERMASLEANHRSTDTAQAGTAAKLWLVTSMILSVIVAAVATKLFGK